MLNGISVWIIIAIFALLLFGFIVVNAWHIRIKWSACEKRFHICYRVLHLVHEINHKDHFEFEDREKNLPKFLRIFRWKKKKDCVMMKGN